MFITGLDAILIVFMLLSALLAMLRGVTREVLSIASWGLAALGAYLAYPMLRDFARAQIQPDALADGILIAGVFFLVLILISFITIRISDLILDSRVGALDRSLGFVFGLARGFILVVIAIMFVDWLWGENQPNWIADARSKPILTDAGDYIRGLLPEDPTQAIEELQGEAPASDAPKTAGLSEDDLNKGYGSSARRGLEQLLESTSAQR